MTFEQAYISNPNFSNRYICPEKLFFYLQTNLSDYIEQIGTSTLGKPIYKLSIGKGSVRVVAWSQMHGNESNATHAMLDLLETLTMNGHLKQQLFEKITLDFIFMLNPDGSEQWTRRNSLDIDLNRDFLKGASKEIHILKNMVKSGGYDFALNLHEQRTIFTTDGKHPATLSFLSPSEDFERTITENRKKCMSIISKVNNKLQTIIPDHIGRYTDEFYPTSTGDNFMMQGLPNILFEGGHFENDYQRKNTRRLYTIALYYTLLEIGNLKDYSDWEEYFKIPENKETHYDIIYRNVKLNTDYDCVLDVAVQFKEVINAGDDDISFVPHVVEVGDVGKKKGWKEVDCTNKKFICQRKYPKLDHPVDFDFE